LAAAVGNIDRLGQMPQEELTTINEIGDKIAESVKEYFQNPAHLEIIARLKDAGICFETETTDAELKSDKLAGLSIVISGTFAKHSRDELKVMIEVNGGKNVSSISKNTSYILAGENMGPSKLDKARSLKIPLISEDDFLKMIE
ncbi:MAG TPA: helix-hairpin-helix domain-containing protein, partial [Prolixibacteraceae bacterium]|nr:helix-hairpin-helix domain-containing protein [Prolixibacteraceae bacterium]